MQRALIALITVVVAVFGGIATVNLKQELMPSIEFPGLIVLTSYPGASHEVVNTDVSTPIETAVQSVPNLDTSTATSTPMAPATVVATTLSIITEKKILRDVAPKERRMPISRMR